MTNLEKLAMRYAEICAERRALNAEKNRICSEDPDVNETLERVYKDWDEDRREHAPWYGCGEVFPGWRDVLSQFDCLPVNPKDLKNPDGHEHRVVRVATIRDLVKVLNAELGDVRRSIANSGRALLRKDAA